MVFLSCLFLIFFCNFIFISGVSTAILQNGIFQFLNFCVIFTVLYRWCFTDHWMNLPQIICGRGGLTNITSNISWDYRTVVVQNILKRFKNADRQSWTKRQKFEYHYRIISVLPDFSAIIWSNIHLVNKEKVTSDEILNCRLTRIWDRILHPDNVPWNV